MGFFKISLPLGRVYFLHFGHMSHMSPNLTLVTLGPPLSLLLPLLLLLDSDSVAVFITAILLCVLCVAGGQCKLTYHYYPLQCNTAVALKVKFH